VWGWENRRDGRRDGGDGGMKRGGGGDGEGGWVTVGVGTDIIILYGTGGIEEG
jgi:hypothetical protein